MAEPIYRKFSLINPTARLAVSPTDRAVKFDWIDALGDQQVAVWISPDLEALGDSRGLQAAYETTIDIIGRVSTDVSAAAPEKIWRTIYHGSDLIGAKKAMNRYLTGVRCDLNAAVKVGVYATRAPGGES